MEAACAIALSELLSQLLGRPPRRRVPSAGELAVLSRLSSSELARELGMGPAAAARLALAFELGRRVERSRTPRRAEVGSAGAVHTLLAPELRGLERERFWVLLLDGKHRLRGLEMVSEGTLTTSLVHPREFFRAAVRAGSAAVIAAHNHPSGDPEPSGEDLAVTRRLFRSGNLLGIPLLDHVVVAPGGYVSIRQRMEGERDFHGPWAGSRGGGQE